MKPHEVAPTVVAEAPAQQTVTTSTRVAPTMNPPVTSLVPKRGESSIGASSWLSKLSPEEDYLLGGVPAKDLKFIRRNVAPVALHCDMMHYATKVKVIFPWFFFDCLCLLFFAFF